MLLRKMAAPLAMAAAVLWVDAARATLIELDDPVYGAASITRDTDQSLDWLDVPISAGRSYDDVSIQFGPGGDFEGFRYALKSEVAALYNSVGIYNISGPPPSTESYAPAVYLQGLVGETSPMTTSGVVADLYVDGQHFGSELRRDDAEQTAIAEDFEVRFADDAPAPGHWLVRPVPEPSTAVLVAAGLLLMARLRRAGR
jgi:hypothetical protein